MVGRTHFQSGPTLTVAKSSQTTAASTRWRELSRDDVRIWGVYPHNLQSVIQTSVNLNTFATACSCTNRGRPCSHILALMLIALDQPERFTVGLAPDWHVDAATTAKDKEDMGQADTESDRLGQMQTGMVELETWLGDMIHQGLAELPNRPKSLLAAHDRPAHRCACARSRPATTRNFNNSQLQSRLARSRSDKSADCIYSRRDSATSTNSQSSTVSTCWPPWAGHHRSIRLTVLLTAGSYWDRPFGRWPGNSCNKPGCSAATPNALRSTNKSFVTQTPCSFLLPGGATFATTLTFSHSAHPLHARLPLPTMITIDTLIQTSSAHP